MLVSQNILILRCHRQTVSYDGFGRKIRVDYAQGPASVIGGDLPADVDYEVTSSRVYAGAHVFCDGRLEYSAFPGGYFDASGSPRYYITDWQGNNAAVVDKAGNVVQKTTYYPYGEPTIEPEGQRYLFGGKEREHAGGRNSYDFGARSLTSYARWSTPDPLADKNFKVSPYVYCHGDPINYFDPDGNREWAVDNPYYKGTQVLKVQHSNDFGEYGGRNHPHGGVDINIGRGSDDLGAPVYATHNGSICRIVPVEDGNGGGIRISIKSFGGEIMTSYMHLQKTMPNLKLGQKVSEGQQIGTIGSTGTKSPHLHYEIKQVNEKGEYKNINPANGPDHLIDAQKLVDNMVFKGAELQELEVVGKGTSNKIHIPPLPVKIITDTDQLQIHIQRMNPNN